MTPPDTALQLQERLEGPVTGSFFKPLERPQLELVLKNASSEELVMPKALLEEELAVSVTDEQMVLFETQDVHPAQQPLFERPSMIEVLPEEPAKYKMLGTILEDDKWLETLSPLQIDDLLALKRQLKSDQQAQVARQALLLEQGIPERELVRPRVAIFAGDRTDLRVIRSIGRLVPKNPSLEYGLALVGANTDRMYDKLMISPFAGTAGETPQDTARNLRNLVVDILAPDGRIQFVEGYPVKEATLTRSEFLSLSEKERSTLGQALCATPQHRAEKSIRTLTVDWANYHRQALESKKVEKAELAKTRAKLVQLEHPSTSSPIDTPTAA